MVVETKEEFQDRLLNELTEVGWHHVSVLAVRQWIEGVPGALDFYKGDPDEDGQD